MNGLPNFRPILRKEKTDRLYSITPAKVVRQVWHQRWNKD